MRDETADCALPACLARYSASSAASKKSVGDAFFASSAMPPETPSRSAWPTGASCDRILDAREQQVRVGERRLGQDHRELVAADPARDVGRAHGALDPLGGHGQHLVAREMARRGR